MAVPTFQWEAGSGAGRGQRARRAGRALRALDAGLRSSCALLGARRRRRRHRALSQQTPRFSPARRRRPGPRVSKPSLGEGAGWRAPAQPARGQGRCWHGRFLLFPACILGQAPSTLEPGRGEDVFILPPLLLYGVVGLMEKAAYEPTLLIGFDGTGKQQPVYRFWAHHTFLKL